MSGKRVTSRSGVAARVRFCSSSQVPVDIAYEVFGEAEHPNAAAAVVITGLNCNSRKFPAGFCEQLAAAGPFRVVRFDNRDCGRSTKMDHQGNPPLMKQLLPKWLVTVAPVYTLEDMADDTAALLAHLGIAAAHVVGISMGGMIAQLVAIRHRALTLSLSSLMSTTGAGDLPSPAFDMQLQYLTKAKSDGFDDQIAYRSAYEARNSWPAAMCDARAKAFIAEVLVAQLEYSMYRAGIARMLTACAQAVPRDELLRGVAVPTLVMHGGRDRQIPPEHGARTAACMPGSRYVVKPDFGHNFPGDERHWAGVIAEIVETAAMARKA
jgi:pimeloyl-ACP methyl ester carboxylesterase